jgi:hypothetical protein
MSQPTVPTFIHFVSSLQECSSTPDDWTCGICLEPAPVGDRPLEVTDCPVTIPCGHIFHTGCLYTWLNGEDVREGLQSRNTCPLCRALLYHGHDPESYLIERVILHLLLAPEFYDRLWNNRTATSWLTGSLQECIDSPDRDGNVGANRDWKLTISHLVRTVTGPDGGFLGDVAICDAETVPFICDGHQQHGHLWLELFLAFRIFRDAGYDNWDRTEVFMEFERWFVQIADRYTAARVLLGQPAIPELPATPGIPMYVSPRDE